MSLQNTCVSSYSRLDILLESTEEATVYIFFQLSGHTHYFKSTRCVFNIDNLHTKEVHLLFGANNTSWYHPLHAREGSFICGSCLTCL